MNDYTEITIDKINALNDNFDITLFMKQKTMIVKLHFGYICVYDVL